MVYQRELLESGIVKTTIDGVMDVEKSLSSLDDLSKYVQNNRLFEVAIHTDNASIDVSYEDVAPIVEKALEIFNNLKVGAIAFVSNNDVMFGLCRQLQLQLVNDKVQITVFRNEETAIRWLTEIKSSV